MRVLGIETSCDETAASVVENGRLVCSNIIASSRETFERSGGVIPEQAARQQTECMLPVIHQALAQADCHWDDIEAIAVTRGPGLLGSLLVGTVTARAIASVHGLPLIGVHHTLGHLSSTWLHAADSQREEPTFPCLALSASGGHTDLWLRTSHTCGQLLGRTRDDAAGEAFDKGAALLGLPYPGGPSISREARDGDPHAYAFPLPLHDDPSLDFSCSGLKTALRYLLRDLAEQIEDPSIRRNVAASYEYALCRHLCDRVTRAVARHPNVRGMHIVGGVSANARLRTMLTEQCGKIPMLAPASHSYCTDNAAMIAAAGAFLVKELGPIAYGEWKTEASLPLEQFVKTS